MKTITKRSDAVRPGDMLALSWGIAQIKRVKSGPTMTSIHFSTHGSSYTMSDQVVAALDRPPGVERYALPKHPLTPGAWGSILGESR